MKNSRIYYLLLLIIIILLVILPGVLPEALLNAANQMLISALFACAFNVLAGQGGMLSFGHAAYFGIGAFATLHAMNALNGEGLLPTPLLPVFGAIAGGLSGIFAGWFSTKRSGVYFSMITLALAELIHALAPHLSSIFGGEAGVSSMRMPAWGISFGTATDVYYLTLAWVVVSLGLLFYFTKTPLGRLTLGLRDNAHRLRFLGYNVHLLRVTVFVISALFSGIAGGLLAMSNEAANYVLFDLHKSSEVVLNAYIGGVTVFLGPAIGAAVMTFFGYVVSDITRAWLLYQGIIFVAVMMFMPAGLSGIARWWKNSKQPNGVVARFFAMWTVGVLITAAGIVFLVEFLQRMMSMDYQSLHKAQQTWTPIELFGYGWLPNSIVTWLIPAVLIVVGVVMIKSINAKWAKQNDKETV